MKIKNSKKLAAIILSGFVLMTGCATEIKQNNIEVIDDQQNEEYIVDYINNIKDSIDMEELETTAIKKFILVTDFIFYDAEINGIKFDELKTETKEEILNIYFTIDNKIETKFPNYKLKIGYGYDNALNYLKEKYIIMSNNIKEKIDENTYNDIKETNDEIIKQDKKNIDKAKDKIKEKIGEDTYNDIKDANKEIIEQDKKNIETMKNISSEGADKAKTKVKEWYQDLKQKY